MTAVLRADAAWASATGAAGRCRTARWRSRPGGSSGWSGPTAPARPPCSTSRSACSRRPRARSRCSAAARPPTRPSWPRSASSPRTRPTYAGLSVADHLRLGARPQPAAGTTPWRARRIERLGLDPAPDGRPALRRPAGPARADPRPRQAPRAADPRRAGRQPRPARPARVPAGPDGGRRRARAQRRAVLAPGLRPRAGLRLPRRAGRLRRCGSPATSRRCSPPTTGSPGRAATRTRCRPTSRSSPASHTDRQPRCSSAPRRPILDPAWTVSEPRPGGPRAGLHGRAARRRSRPRRSRRWRCCDDLADLAPVPRLQAATAVAAVVAVAVVLALTGPGLAELGTRRRGRRLRPARTAPTSPSSTPGSSSSPSLPALIGVFWGAPLVARELEAGTHRLVWNQSVTRTRWLATKLAVTTALAAARRRRPWPSR